MSLENEYNITSKNQETKTPVKIVSKTDNNLNPSNNGNEYKI